MSEKLYACLLRLYPSQFREAYGDEALQVFRDRARQEKGAFASFRLWLDLLADLAVSLPREYAHAASAPVSASIPHHFDGVPSFHLLENESPRPGALLFGGIVSLTALSVFSLLLKHAGNSLPYHPSAVESLPQTALRASGSQSSTETSAGDGESAIAGASRGVSEHLASQHAASASIRIEASEPQLDAAERRHVIEAVIRNLSQHYFDPAAARKMVNALSAHAKAGDDDVAVGGAAFAGLLTSQMRGVSGDMHLEVVYSQDRLPDVRLQPTPEVRARYRKELEQDNCAFQKVEILPHNIGYLKLDAFPDPSICRSTATAAMASVNGANAIIFDLRDNGGGSGEMVSLIAAYLFDHPEFIFDPRSGPTKQSWTESPVPGSSLADKPVFVLTSASTVSAAEDFCYNLKMLKRATFVGETTRGSAHAGVWHRIDDHFGVGVPEVRAINPYSTNDWEGVGVEPDVKVAAADALQTAEKLAASTLPKK
jgi:Peptidase family S41